MAAPKGNTNAEKWTYDLAVEFFNKAVSMSKNQDYDFIGEIAYDLDEDKGVFDYLIEKFPDLKKHKERIKNNCEVNCFRNMKKESINIATGMINLKSNHGWTDRVASDHTTNGESINITPIQWVDGTPNK
jgi:hypothetical protein